MNSLQITGVKISSPTPVKKTTPIPQKKTSKKPSIPAQAPARTILSTKPSKPKVSAKKEQEPKKKELPSKVQLPPPEPVETVEKSEETSVEQPAVEESHTIALQQEKPADFQVVLRYNHYKDKFPCKNGVISFSIPNEKYCFGLVFLGNYQPKLRHFKTRQIIEPLTTGKAQEFSWKVQQNQVYEIQIQEDEQEQSKREKHVYRAPEEPKKCSMKKNSRVQQLTQEMKKLSVEELGSEKHRQMLEQRDLEDILFS